MRTIIDIPDEQLKPLDALCREEGISRAEIIRGAIAAMLAARRKQARKYKDISKHPAFGMFKDNSPFGDGLEYQLKIRAEWDDRDHAITERLKRGKPKKKT